MHWERDYMVGQYSRDSRSKMVSSRPPGYRKESMSFVFVLLLPREDVTLWPRNDLELLAVPPDSTTQVLEL